MMTKLRENQDLFIAEMEAFETWRERFSYLIELGDNLPVQCPEDLLSHLLENCRSQSYFKAGIIDGKIYVNGWSNASVMRGILFYIIRIFDGLSSNDFKIVKIDFHEKSGLINNLTPFRKSALLEIICRIVVLLSGNSLK